MVGFFLLNKRAWLVAFSLLIGVVFTIQPTVNAAFGTEEQRYIDLGLDFADPKGVSSLCTTGGVNGSTTTSLPYELPAAQGKTGREEPISADGAVPSTGGKVTFSGFAALGQEYRDFYITMRWNYTSWNWNGTNSGVDSAQLAWMKEQPRLVLVTNPRTGKSIVAAALETGPAPWTGVDGQPNNNPKEGWVNPQKGTPSAYTGRVSGFPPTAIDALGAVMGTKDGAGDVLTYQWAPDQTAKPGPVSGSVCSSAGANGWTLDGANAMTTYYQNRSPWASQAYGNGTIGACGCGPTSMAMIIKSLNGYDTDPKKMADFFSSHNGQNADCASEWIWQSQKSLFEGTFKIKINQIATTGGAIKDAISRGSFVLMSQGRGMFTDGGHIMVARGVTDNGNILVADPASEKNTTSTLGFTEYQIVGNGSENPAGRAGDYGFLRGAWEISVANTN